MIPLRFRALLLWLPAFVATAQAPPPLTGDAALGKALADKDCVSCHARRFGNADAIYLRADRRMQTPAQLLAQVRYCNVELGTNYFPEDEEHVAAYLNARYYHFAP